MPPPRPGEIYVALAVVAMGWSWSVFLAQSALQDALEIPRGFWPDGSRVQYGRVPPQFWMWRVLHWLYVDDYGELTLEAQDSAPAAAEADMVKARGLLRAAGLGSHKECAERDLPASMGICIRDRVLQVVDEKMKKVVLSTEHLLTLDRVSPRCVESLLGLWTWVILPARGGLAIFDAIYRWVALYRHQKTAELWDSVRGELCAAAAMSIFFVADLSRPWHEWIYMTDASPLGFGVVATRSNTEELRTFSQAAEASGWRAKLELAYSEQEKEVNLDPRDAEERRFQEEKEQSLSEARTPGLLEVFSGQGVLSAAFRARGLSWTEEVDALHGPQSDLLNTGNVVSLLRRIFQRVFWLVCVTPPCGALVDPDLDPVADSPDEKTMETERRTYLALVAIELIVACRKAGTLWAMTNPRDSPLWAFPPLQDFRRSSGAYQIDYDRFSDEGSRTPWMILTNVGELRVLRAGAAKPAGPQSEEPPTDHAPRPGEPLWAAQAAEALRLRAPRPLGVAGRIRPGPGVPPAPAGTSLAVMEGLPPALEPQARWHHLFSGRWSFDEHQNIRECRTVVMVIRRLSRSEKAWGTRVLIFTDSLVTLGTLVKGRASSPGLLHLARQSAAVELALGIRVYYRWTPSGKNWADGPSRLEGLGLARDTRAKIAEEAALTRGEERRLRVDRFQGLL